MPDPATGSSDPPDGTVAQPTGPTGAAPDGTRLRPASADPEAGTLLAGKYRLSEKVGEGGMGSVWVAQQVEGVRRKVAVKLIKPGMDSKQVLARFEAERQALAMMDHPNIARVFDADLHDGRPFFVMELVKGVPITEYCDARKLTPRQRLELFVPVCQAIQHAHQKGVIHRDIKPGNVLVALYDDRPVPKVIDFGVAKATGAALTEHTLDTGFGGIVGTPQYMSPEQATLNNLDIDTRTDVYSLGVLLYELLAGSPPFKRQELEKKGLLEVLRVVREEEPPKPSTKLSTADALPSLAANRNTEPKALTGLLRSELDWVVMKALEKDRQRRYETANGFAADVQRYLAGEPVMAHPPTAAYRLRKFVRRHRGPVLATAVVLLAVLLGFGGTTVGLVEAKRQQGLAEDAAGREADERKAAEKERTVAEKERDEKEKARAAEEEQKKTATAERDAKQRAAVRADGLRLGAEATAAVRTDPGLALLLAAEGVRRHPHHLTFAALYAAAGECREERTISAGTADVRFARFSPDGRRVLVARGDGSGASVHDAATGKLITSWHGYGLPVGAIDWSADGKRVAAAVEGCVRAEYTDAKEPAAAVFTDRTVYVWDADTGKELAHLGGHKRRVVGVRFSPDGGRILTACWDGVARLFDARSGELVQTLDEHTTSLLPAVFSRDGKKVLTLSSAANRQAFDDKDIASLARPGGAAVDPGPSDRPARFGRTYTQVGYVTSAEEKLARVWDADSGKVVAALRKTSGGLFTAALVPTDGALNPDGTRAAVAFTRDVAAVWDATANGTEKFLLTGHTGSVNAITFSPNGQLLATAGEDKSARLWDAATGKETARLRGHQGAVRSVQFSDDGRRLLTTSDDGTARLWDVATGEEVAALRGHAGPVRDARFGPKGDKVVTAGDSTARIWNTAPPPEVARVVPAHTAPLTALAFSPDGSRLLTASEDETAKLFDPAAGKEVSVFGPGMVLGKVRSAAFAPDGRSVVTATENTSGGVNGKEVNRSALHVWDAEPAADRHQFRDHDTGAAFAAFSPAGDRVVSVDDGGRKSKGFLVDGSHGSLADAGKVRVWDVATEKLLFTAPELVREGSRPEFSRDGKYLLTSPKTGPAALLDGNTGKKLRAFPPDGDIAPQVVALSPDGKRVLTARDGRSAPATLWDADTGGVIAELTGAKEAVSAARFSPDGRRLVTLEGRVATVWDAGSGKRLATLAGHEKAVIAVDFAPDGTRLLTGSDDRTAALWDADTGGLLAVYVGHPGPVKFVAYSPTGRHLATGSTDGTVRVWSPDPAADALARAPRQLTPAERLRYEIPDGGAK